MAIGDFFKKLFGSTPKEVVDKAETFAEETLEKAKVTATPIVEKAEELIEAAKEKVSEHMPEAKETLENAVETVKEKANEIAHKAEEMADNAISNVKSAFANDASEDAEEIRTKPEDMVKPANENGD